MSPVDLVLSRVQGITGKAPRWRAVCPACGGKAGKFALTEGDNGGALVRCFAGCTFGEIVAGLGLTPEQLFPERPEGVHRSPPIRRPWPARDVIKALRGELQVAWILLADVKSGQPHSDEDRERARVALDRIESFMDELEHAH